MNASQDMLADDFRFAFGAILADDQLRKLAEACERDDSKLMQCATVFPTYTIAGNLALPWERCCALAFTAPGGTVMDAWTHFLTLTGDDFQPDRR